MNNNQTKFEQIVRVTPAFDKRDSNPKRDYGISSCRIFFILKNEKGAVQFVIGTDWFIPSVQREMRRRNHDSDVRFDKIKPEAWDLGYHSPAPRYEEQSSMECDLLPTGKCFYDGSTLNAQDWMAQFIEGGTEWLWPALEKYHAEIFTPEGLT